MVTQSRGTTLGEKSSKGTRLELVDLDLRQPCRLSELIHTFRFGTATSVQAMSLSISPLAT